MKKWIKSKWQYWMVGKKIVHTTTHAPGELVAQILHKGNKYVRIAITNRVHVAGYNPVTDVRWQDITRVDQLPCRLVAKWYKFFGKKLVYKSLKIEK